MDKCRISTPAYNQGFHYFVSIVNVKVINMLLNTF